MKITLKPDGRAGVPALCACCAWTRVVGMGNPRTPRECPVDRVPCALLGPSGPDGECPADAVLAACAEGCRLYRDEQDVFIVATVRLAAHMPDVMDALVASGWPDLP